MHLPASQPVLFHHELEESLSAFVMSTLYSEANQVTTLRRAPIATSATPSPPLSTARLCDILQNVLDLVEEDMLDDDDDNDEDEPELMAVSNGLVQ